MKTTVAISKKTRERLASIGNKDSTFDDIIRKLLEEWDFEK